MVPSTRKAALPSSSSSSMTTTISPNTVMKEQAAELLKFKTAHRDKKRQHLEELFKQQQRIREEMSKLQQDLHSLDDEIDTLEEQAACHNNEEDDFDDPANMLQRGTTVSQNNHHNKSAAATSATATQWNDEEMYLTDPMTQLPQHQMPPSPQIQDDPACEYEREWEEAELAEQDMQQEPQQYSEHLAQHQQLLNHNSNVSGERLLPEVSSAAFAISRQDGVQPTLQVQSFKPAGRPKNAAGNGTLDSFLGNGRISSISCASDREAQTRQSELPSTSFPWTKRVSGLLYNTFKIGSFRENQRDIIDATLSGQDCFVIMRTGGGKSLTYQLPALYEGRFAEYSNVAPKVTFVISPLISLIHDQEEQMNAFYPGSALSFTSNLKGGVSEHARRWALVRTPGSGVCLVFVTPEKIAKSGKIKAELEKLHKNNRLGRIVIDECHCCSQWGHDFRPDYMKLGMLKAHFPNVPLLAVTATASDQVRDDCCQLLNIRRNHRIFKSTANRPNLKYGIRIKSDNKLTLVQDMARFIKTHHPRGAGIVYTLSKREAVETAKQLSSLGVKAEPYHADVSPTAKERVHRKWMKNELQCVTATIAFGLGINKPDVRFVLHHSISKTLENYYQESGRAGRDGGPADCILYYAPKDISRMRSMIDTDSRGTLDSFWQMVRYANDFGTDARCRTIILRALGEVDTAALPPRPVDDEGEDRDVTLHAKMAIRLIQWSLSEGDKVTVKQLVDIWRSKSLPEWAKGHPPTGLTKDECERIVVTMMTYDIVLANVEWNAYGSTLYLKIGEKAIKFLSSPTAKFSLYFPPRPSKAKAGGSSKANAGIPAVSASGNGWISAKERPKSALTARSTKKPTGGSAATTKKRRQSTGSTVATTKKKKPAAKPKRYTSDANANAIIELEESSNDEDESPYTATRTRISRHKGPRTLSQSVGRWNGDLMDDSPSGGSEVEFQGYFET